MRTHSLNSRYHACARQIGTDLLIALRESGFDVTGFNVRSPTLDDVFLEVTGSTLREAQEDASPVDEDAPGQEVSE